LQTEKTAQEKEILKATGERVRFFRESKNLSLSEFGSKINRDKSSLSKLERGIFSIDANFLHLLLKAYPRFRLEWLILGKGEAEYPPIDVKKNNPDTK
jgi:transcriptional regulator with XRE-family HTH domain